MALVRDAGVDRSARETSIGLAGLEDLTKAIGYPASTVEAWIDGHVYAFAFFVGFRFNRGPKKLLRNRNPRVCVHGGSPRSRFNTFQPIHPSAVAIRSSIFALLIQRLNETELRIHYETAILMQILPIEGVSIVDFRIVSTESKILSRLVNLSDLLSKRSVLLRSNNLSVKAAASDPGLAYTIDPICQKCSSGSTS